MKNYLCFLGAITLALPCTTFAQFNLGSALVGFKPPVPTELSSFVASKTKPLAARKIRPDGMAVVIVSTGKPYTAQAALTAYTERVFAELSPRISISRATDQSRGFQIRSFPVSATETAWVVYPEPASAQIQMLPKAFVAKTATCAQVIPAFFPPPDQEILAVGSVSKESLAQDFEGRRYERNTTWTSELVIPNNPNAGYKWRETDQRCQDTGPADAPPDPPEPDTPEAPNVSYQGGSLPAPTYTTSGAGWWSGASYGVACYVVRNNVNSETYVQCFLV